MSDLDHSSLDRILPPSSGSADWDDVLRRAGRTRERRGRRLAAVVAALLVLVVGTASAFGTVRGLFGDEQHVARFFFASEGKRGSFGVRILSVDLDPPHTSKCGVGGSFLSRRGSPCAYHTPVCASHRAWADCPNWRPRAGVERAPRGLRDPSGRSEAARRDHDEGTPARCVRAHPATARSPEARRRHADLHARHRVGHAGEFFTEQPRTLERFGPLREKAALRPP